MKLSHAIEVFLLSKEIAGFSPNTLCNYRVTLGRLSEFLYPNDPELDAVTADDLRGFLHQLQTTPPETDLIIPREIKPLGPKSIRNVHAPPHCLTSNRFVGLNPNEILSECFRHRYGSVFVLDPLPFQENGIRDDDAVMVGYLDEWLARDYSASGYCVVRVPVQAPQERLAFALERLSDQGLALQLAGAD